MSFCDSEEAIAKAVTGAHAAFRSNRTRPVKCRRYHLEQLARFVDECKEDILAALSADLGKSKQEGYLLEYLTCMSDLNHALNNLEAWAEPEKVSTPWIFMFDKGAWIRRMPYGVVTMISPWNYPILTLIQPLIGAIAAGNCVVIKPSEVAQATERLIREKFTKYLDTECFPVVCGGVQQCQWLLSHRTDYIFFTGAFSIARHVMRAAAEFCTPLTLECGGKSPAIIDESSNLYNVARRIVNTKLYNCGQTCVAIDYVLCKESIQAKLVNELKAAAQEFLGKNPQESQEYARVINDRHFERLKNVLAGTSGKIEFGGEMDAADRYMNFTVITDVTSDDELMKDEIFGPFLPIVTVGDIEEAIEFVNSRERPLSLYVFSPDAAVVDRVADNTISGTFCANDAILQTAAPSLPFGGVGQSGIGCYHGKHSFDTFSHRQGYLYRRHGLEFLNTMMRYHPVTPFKVRALELMLCVPRKGIIHRFLPSLAFSLFVAAFTFYLLKWLDHS